MEASAAARHRDTNPRTGAGTTRPRRGCDAGRSDAAEHAFPGLARAHARGQVHASDGAPHEEGADVRGPNQDEHEQTAIRVRAGRAADSPAPARRARSTSMPHSTATGSGMRVGKRNSQSDAIVHQPAAIHSAPRCRRRSAAVTAQHRTIRKRWRRVNTRSGDLTPTPRKPAHSHAPPRKASASASSPTPTGTRTGRPAFPRSGRSP